MRNFKKHLVLAASLFLCANVLTAQEQTTHEISGWLGGGLSTLDYSLDYGKQSNGIGGLIGIGYNYHLSHHWSVGTGVELSLYNSKSKLYIFSDAYDSNDGAYDFEYRTSTARYKESQQAYYVNLPLTIQYQTYISDVTQIYLSGGFKVGFPVSSKFKIKEGEFKTVGHYPNWKEQEGREEFMESDKKMGFGTFDLRKSKDDFKVKTAFLATVEAGIKWRMEYGRALYTGFYLDYGLNDIKKHSNKHLVEYNAEKPTAPNSNSIAASQWKMGENIEKMTSKVIPISAGVKIRYSFSFE